MKATPLLISDFRFSPITKNKTGKQKKCSLEINRESSSTENAIRKTRSMNSNFLVDMDELLNVDDEISTEFLRSSDDRILDGKRVENPHTCMYNKTLINI